MGIQYGIWGLGFDTFRYSDTIAILKICGTFGYSSILLFFLYFFGRCILERTLVLMYGERIYTFSMFSFASDFNSEPDRFSF